MICLRSQFKPSQVKFHKFNAIRGFDGSYAAGRLDSGTCNANGIALSLRMEPFGHITYMPFVT
jgi:hypothetical protein